MTNPLTHFDAAGNAVMVDVTAKAIRYNLKAHKLFVFNKETEERIRFEVK